MKAQVSKVIFLPSFVVLIFADLKTPPLPTMDAYFAFNGNLNDSSGHGRNLTDGLGTAYGTGKFSSCVNAGDQIRSAPFWWNFGFDHAYTLMFWFKQMTAGSRLGFTISNGGDTLLHMEEFGFTQITCDFHSSTEIVLSLSAGPYSLDAFHHFCLRSDGTHVEIYLDGVLNVSDDIPVSDMDFETASNLDNNCGANFFMDELAFFSVAVDRKLISAIAAGTKPLSSF